MNNENIEMIKKVALKFLTDEIAILGGATTGLFITDSGVEEFRPTMQDAKNN